MKIRKGDRIACRFECRGYKYVSTVMVKRIRGWWIGAGFIEVRHKAASNSIIILRSDVVRIVQKREDIKKFWEYL